MADELLKFAPVPGVSRSRIDRSGVVLRDFWRGDFDVTDEVVEAVADMVRFRETFQLPMSKTATGLRSMVSSEWPELRAENRSVPVVQRLKRQEQILSKLERMSETKLSNMGDIGGCRAVLDSRARVDGVVKRIEKTWPIHGKVRDTRDQPAESGYRAVHIIVIRDGRRVEIQLRDTREHEWAVAVERTGMRLEIPLKEGLGPDDLKEYFRLASHGIYLDSQGIDPDPKFLAEFRDARVAVRNYFAR